MHAAIVRRLGTACALLLCALVGCETPLDIIPGEQPVVLTPSILVADTVPFPTPSGQTYVVNWTTDVIADDGLVTLREAIILATENPVPNAVMFDPSIFPPNRTTPILLRESLLVRGEGDVIDGSGSDVLLDGSAIPGSRSAVVALRAPGTRLTGLTIGNVLGAAVLVELIQNGASAVGIDRCHIVNCSLSGIFTEVLHDSRLVVTGTTFEAVGGEPVYHPLATRPHAPRVWSISGNLVRGYAGPGARVEFFVGENLSTHMFVGATQANEDGSFVIEPGGLSPGQTINATCISPGGSTSALRTVGGIAKPEPLSALLGGTGPLSDGAGAIDASSPVLRWPVGTRLVIHAAAFPVERFEQAIRDFVLRIGALTNGQVTAELRVGDLGAVPNGAKIVEIVYVEPTSAELNGSEGRAFLNANGNTLTQVRVVVSAASTEPGVSVHELGHMLGLHHLCVNGSSLMDTAACGSVGVRVTIHPEGAGYYDAVALNALYGPTIVPGDTLADLQALGLIP